MLSFQSRIQPPVNGLIKGNSALEEAHNNSLRHTNCLLKSDLPEKKLAKRGGATKFGRRTSHTTAEAARSRTTIYPRSVYQGSGSLRYGFEKRWSADDGVVGSRQQPGFSQARFRSSLALLLISPPVNHAYRRRGREKKRTPSLRLG